MAEFRKCYEPHLRDYPGCFEECGCDTCEAPLFSEEDEAELKPEVIKRLQDSKSHPENLISQTEMEKDVKETTAYKSEFLVIECPHCNERHYLNVADDYGEGNIPENGRKMTCQKCKKTFRVVPDFY